MTGSVCVPRRLPASAHVAMAEWHRGISPMAGRRGPLRSTRRLWMDAQPEQVGDDPLQILALRGALWLHLWWPVGTVCNLQTALEVLDDVADSVLGISTPDRLTEFRDVNAQVVQAAAWGEVTECAVLGALRLSHSNQVDPVQK